MAEASTITMNISLPEPLKRYVDGRVASGFYGSVSEFVREAIREKLLREHDRERAHGLLASKLLEGLDSGDPVTFTDGYLDQKKQAFQERQERRESK